MNGHPTGKKRQFRVQPTKKLGCMAQITIRELTVYPEYTILPSCKTKHEVRTKQTQKHTIYYIIFPIYR